MSKPSSGSSGQELQPDKQTPSADLARISWTLYIRHARTLIGYSAWLLVPMALSVLLSLAFPVDAIDVASTISGTLGLIIGTWVTIVIITATPILQNKKRIRPRVLSKRAWNLFLPYILLSIAINLLTGIGLVLLIVPGLLVAVRLSFAQILLVQERLDPLEAIKESYRRTTHKTGMLLKRLFFGILFIGLPYGLLAAFIAIGFASTRGLDLWTFFVHSQPTLFEIITFQFLDILFLPIFLIYWVLMYEDIG